MTFMREHTGSIQASSQQQLALRCRPSLLAQSWRNNNTIKYSTNQNDHRLVLRRMSQLLLLRLLLLSLLSSSSLSSSSLFVVIHKIRFLPKVIYIVINFTV